MRKKILNGGKALQAQAVTVGGAHWKHDYDTFLSRGDDYLREKLATFHRINVSQAEGLG